MLDLHSKMIVGNAYHNRMKQEIVLESLRQAVFKTKVTEGMMWKNF